MFINAALQFISKPGNRNASLTGPSILIRSISFSPSEILHFICLLTTANGPSENLPPVPFQNRPSVITCASANNRNCNLSHCPASHTSCSSSMLLNYRRPPNSESQLARRILTGDSLYSPTCGKIWQPELPLREEGSFGFLCSSFSFSRNSCVHVLEASRPSSHLWTSGPGSRGEVILIPRRASCTQSRSYSVHLL